MKNRITSLYLLTGLLGFMLLAGYGAAAQDGKGKPIIGTQTVKPYERPKISEEQEKDRRYAFELWKEHKDLEALPWMEKLAKAVPDDAQALEGLAACLLSHSYTLQDGEQQKAEQVRVRQLLVQAQKLGYSSDLIETLLTMIPENGAPVVYSKDAEINRIMKQAEADFSAGKLDGAKQGYFQVLLIDPNNYDAALFLGDVYFVKKDYSAAGEWFSRTVAINPNHETAYRYWGDALAKQGKYAEARQKYIEAVVAEPYTRASWNGINKWTQFVKQPLAWYKIQSPNALQIKDSKNININIDASSLDKKDGSSAWFIYELARASWVNGGTSFKKEFPNEKEYRHSLKEETQALGLVADSAEQAEKEKHEKLNDNLKALVKLKHAGFLEAYILFNAADAGIAQDYQGYRKDHRDKLIQYLNEIVVPPAPKTGN
jgi:tetratricopeptide (TPR) repeat protein